jgi:ABC-type nitrate/sulfonate/bicarbonate transport system substrate-binding protein
LPSRNLDRRTFLSRTAMAAGGLALAGSTGSLLAACGSSSPKKAATSSGSTSFGRLDYQLSWVKNVEFAGNYIADTQGYYTKAGFSSVNLIAGGPTVQQDAVVAAGKAFVGISSPDITSPAVLKGAPLVIVGALYQKNPFCIMSLASKPLADPQAMIGKKIGVQATNTSAWYAFLKANNIDKTKLTTVPVQFDPSPLAAGTVDGWFSFITNEPIELGQEGHKTVTFLLNDYNYPLVSEVWVVTADSIKNDRDKVKAVLKADIQGWRDSLKDPSEGAKLAADKYGKDQKLDAGEQTLESKAQNKLILTADTMANGIGTITPALIEGTIKTLGLSGIDITAAKLFDTSLIDEVYQENPDLKAAV